LIGYTDTFSYVPNAFSPGHIARRPLNASQAQSYSYVVQLCTMAAVHHRGTLLN